MGELKDHRLASRLADEERRNAIAEAAQLKEEKADLLRNLRRAERATMASDMQVRALTSEVAQARSAQQQQRCNGVSSAPMSLEDIVSALVTFELRQLSACSSQE